VIRLVCTTIGNELSGPKGAMDVMSQQKQSKSVVEHKGVYPKLGSEAVIHLQAQSLPWDTFCAEGSQISLVGVLPQSSQQLAWDTLSHLRETDEIAGILITFHFVRAIRLIGRLSQDIRRILQKFLSRTVADPPSQKCLSRGSVLVAYIVEPLKMSNATVHLDINRWKISGVRKGFNKFQEPFGPPALRPVDGESEDRE
jgi:hypothetical protein